MDINYIELEEIGFYEYVARHYWQMSREQLASFVKEISYEAEQALGKKEYNMVESAAIDNLLEFEV